MNSWREANLVLPNRSATGLAAVLLAMWYAGASQNNGAAYLLCFVVASLALMSLPHTWANLRGVAVKAGPIKPVFAGEHFVVPVTASGPTRRKHFAVQARIADSGTDVRFPRLSVSESVQTEALMPARRRGVYEKFEVQLSSTFPLGFFTARRWVVIRQKYVAYPEPVGGLPLPLTFDPARETGEGSRSEGDDYAGLRSWIPGESMRHIDWKAVSRGHPMMTKQWNSESGHRLMFEWDTLTQLGIEARLSQLARWIVDAENRGFAYGLRMPREKVDPGQGEVHFHRCLHLLAAFQNRDAEPPIAAVRSSV